MASEPDLFRAAILVVHPELAALADAPEHHATMIASVAVWAGRQ